MILHFFRHNAFIYIGFFMLFLTSCSQDGYKRIEGMIWNTSYHITYENEKDLTDSIMQVFNIIDGSLNVFNESSLVSQVNKADSLKIDSDFAAVYENSRKINRISDGAFDPTLGPLIDAWGFGKGHKATSDTLRLDSLLSITGLERTSLKNNILYKENPLIRFNFSAIAKGYACDRIGEMLKRNGTKSYLVEIGGEIRCEGLSPSNGKWTVSIDKPILSDSVLHDSQCIILLSQGGVATSGNYRNFHKSGNDTYGHTLSSKTGRPVKTDVLSATIVAPTAMEADALATTCMALGFEKSKILVEKTNVAVLLVLSNGEVWQNKKFKDLESTAK